MKRVFIAFIVIVFYSCQTNNSNFEITLDKLIIDEINDFILNDELFKAYQLLTYYEIQNPKNSDYYSTQKKLYDILPEKLDSLLENKSWDDFFITFKNLQTLEFDLSSYDYNNILYNYILDNLSVSLFKSGIFLGESRLDYAKLEDNQLQKIYESYIEISNESDFINLVNELKNRNIYKEELKTTNYLDGLITIFVNKGIKIEKGVGSQDLMIGSGFFIDKMGYAVTNYHVISSLVDPEYEGLSNLYIKLNGSIDKIPAKVIGWDPILDIALIKVAVKPEYIYSFSTKENLKIGEKVIALGSPGGLGSSVTSGIVSSNDRTFLELGSVIQIDSPINPGNSGGPLIDENKNVTNIVFAGIESFEGINFAIPIKYLKKELKSLYRGGQVEHVWIGAGVVYRKKKLELVYIKPGSPANYLGLKKGDIIKSINGIQFSSIVEIQDYLMNFSPMEIINFEYDRDGEAIIKQICLESRPNKTMDTIIKGDSSDHLYIPLFGMDIKYNGKILWNKEYLINDVYPGSIADELDLLPGDIIEVKNWEYNKEFEAVILQLVIQSKKEGYWKKNIQIAAPININFFI